jgi:tripartite-type tricarboxylate transporter receptor subunit TctC
MFKPGESTRTRLRIAIAAIWFGLTFLLPQQSPAQTIEQFYRGKTVTLIVSAGVGGGYDTYARALAAHLGGHIPGAPTVVVQNMTGAGGLRAALFLYSTAAKDGSVVGLVQSTSVLSPLLGTTGADFDPLRFSWIGSISREYSLCVSWHESKVRTVQDLLQKEFVVGSSGAGTAMELYPHVLNRLLGTHIKVISGYDGGAPVLLAMERGEVDGRCGASLATYQAVRPDWIRDRKINFLLQTSLEKDPQLPNIPWVVDYVSRPQERAILDLVLAPRLIQRPVLGPPDIPRDRLLALQGALDATLEDPAFLKQAKAQKLDISLMRAGDVYDFVDRLAKIPDNIRAEAAQMLGGRK